MRSLLLTFTFLLLLNPCATYGQKPLRVLVDASKDGGLWWFPQGNSNKFDPKQHHQGKALADFMRSKGWEVTELGRGEVLTVDTLRDVDVVVRPPAWFDYTTDEIVAYRDSVMGGTRLLLMGLGGNKADPVAGIFGLRFDSLNRFAAVRQWVPHPLTSNITGRDVSWASIKEAPPNAVLLAWLNYGVADARPVLGYLPYGSGYVVFVGQASIFPDLDQSFFGGLIDTLGRYDLEAMKQLPVPDPVVASAQLLEFGPGLLKPLVDATLPQPEIGAWRFDWEDAPGAKGYEIVVLGPGAMVPAVQTTTRTSDYVLDVRQGYIADHNLQGWSWRVRARFGDGAWGPWSRIRRFNVAPRTR